MIWAEHHSKRVKMPKTTFFAKDMYIHGSLEDEAGYDLACVNGPFMQRFIEHMKNGRAKNTAILWITEIKLYTGVVKECVVVPYAGHYTALIVNTDDIKSLQYCTKYVRNLGVYDELRRYSSEKADIPKWQVRHPKLLEFYRSKDFDTRKWEKWDRESKERLEKFRATKKQDE